MVLHLQPLDVDWIDCGQSRHIYTDTEDRVTDAGSRRCGVMGGVGDRGQIENPVHSL